MIIKTGYYLMWTKDLVQYSIFFKFEDDIVFEISIMKKNINSDYEKRLSID
jgi:hypothetical protein